MNYGKNQLALLKFLEKYPNQWHRIKRRKAIDAAKGLMKKRHVVVCRDLVTHNVIVKFCMPQMLIKQN